MPPTTRSRNLKRNLLEHQTLPSKKLRIKDVAMNENSFQLGAGTAAEVISNEEPIIATLTFSFEEGKQHLVSVDKRFEELFKSTPCKPFEELETVHPFRALATSILSQQISWKAARSITHRFQCLFNPSFPGQPTLQAGIFPSPEQVANMGIETLRSAGLSTRKAEYVKDLASRFADGRLSAEKLSKANDEELMKMLLEVRGVGRWTVDMFSIFHMRRPNILPVGDLGVQRGVLLWFLSRYASGVAVRLPRSEDSISPAFEQTDGGELQPPPIGLSILKERLKGKKVRGAFLTPLELEELTKVWEPYRSLGVYYMWQLAEGER